MAGRTARKLVAPDILQQNPSIQGMCVAFEPFRMDPARRDYALYVLRKGQTITKGQLLPPDYEPLYGDGDWYKDGRKQRELTWGEPWHNPRKEGSRWLPAWSHSALACSLAW